MNESVTLTPAQVDFLQQNLRGFQSDHCNAELAGRAASQRYFVRIRHGGTPYILIVWDSRDEDWGRFLAIGHDRPVTGTLLPVIYAADPRHGLILEEDLGTVTLKSFCMNSATDRAAIVARYHETLDALRIWQLPQVGHHPVIAARSMDIETFMWETAYFARYCVTDYCGCEALLGPDWEAERTRLAGECAALSPTAIHRDFQSENVMLHKGGVRFVDFQGARLGPPQYDVASLLFDPYNTRIDAPMLNELYLYYCERNSVTATDLRSLHLCAAQRLMQALGAYGNLSLHKGKEWYREYIPTALGRLDGVMEQLEGFPAIAGVVRRCCEEAGGEQDER
jgi:aminoglycoside/choline kinase family phosphotransferase